MNTIADRIEGLPGSLITTAIEWAINYKAVNLASGSPGFTTPEELKQKAGYYIDRDSNQYTMAAGLPALRSAIAVKMKEFNAVEPDPDREITITCGTAEALFLALFTTINRGDEVIIFEPAFETYLPVVQLAGGVPRIIKLSPPSWELDREGLESLFNDKTAAIIVNTPHNPSGKVFTRQELEFIAGLCQRYDVITITDEIYEHIIYDGLEHVSMASLPGMPERTITTGGLSKTFNCTGWRIGYCVAPERITEAIRKLHTYVTVCAPTPLQEAGVYAYTLPEEYFDQLMVKYNKRRDLICSILAQAGFAAFKPQGSYFVMADFSPFSSSDGVEFAHYLAREIGVCAVPERAFCSAESSVGRMLRFCFCRDLEILEEAGRRLQKIK